MRIWLLMLACLLACSPIAQAVPDLTSNLVALWPMNEGSGTTVGDSSGNGLTAAFATSTAAPAWQTSNCHSGACVVFTAVPETRVNLPANALLNITGNLTLGAWVRVTTVSLDNQTLIDGRDTAYPWPGYALRLSGGTPQFWSGSDATTSWKTAGYSIPPNEWHHIAVTLTGTTIQFYIDGFPAGTVTGNVPLTYAGARWLGGKSTGGDPLSGALDDVAIYSRALTAEDIQALVGVPSVPQPLPGYQLVFEDDFSGTSLNTSKWSTYFVCWNVRTLSGNAEQEYYVEAGFPGLAGVNPHQFSGGVLSLVANTSPNTAASGGLPYTSGFISTEQSKSFLYGYVEARLRVPQGQGLWPAFWMIPSDCGDHLPEIDILEVLGNATNVIYQYDHADGPAPTNLFGTVDKHGFIDAGTGFHTYGFEWRADYMRWIVDGRETRRVTNYATQPHYIILNLAVGGTWPGNPDGTTPFPSALQIDYVRLYAPPRCP